MSQRRACLFGGALFAAGIAGQASGDEFQWDYTNYGMRQYGFVYVLGGDFYSHDYAHPGGPYTTQPYATFATTEISGTRLNAEYVTYNYQAGAVAYGFFTVTDQCDLKVSWDLTNTGAYAGAPQVQLYDATAGMSLLEETSSAGTFFTWLYPDHVYYAQAAVGGGAYGQHAFATFEMIVPSPGAGLLAGMGIGVGALRRRRRE